MWQINIDTGGTFTDCYAISPAGEVCRLKVLSSAQLRATVKKVVGNKVYLTQNWQKQNVNLKGFFLSDLGESFQSMVIISFSAQNSYVEVDGDVSKIAISGKEIKVYTGEEAPTFAARLLTQSPYPAKLPPLQMKLGTTRGTNALLEEKGVKPVLITTKGFADLLRIGTQQRKNLFSLVVEKDFEMAEVVLEAEECISAEGDIVKELAEPEINKILRKIFELKPQVVVIAFKNSYRNPIHEKNLMHVMAAAGVKNIVCSAELEASVKMLMRTQTAVVNAYLLPVINSYVNNIVAQLHSKENLKLMSSSGGLVPAGQFHPKDSLLSGPAGGVVGCTYVAKKLGVERLLAFDMGGTSTDVSRFAGKFDYTYELNVGVASISAPSLYLETVAAGGGSVCSFDGYKFKVGPESAGAVPGPACYGAGGPLTITDVNLLLGRLNPEVFSIPVRKDLAQKILNKMKGQYESLQKLSDKEILEGFLLIANEKMAKAIQKISTRKGYDPKDYALVAFGGAGGMHACAIADILSMDEVIIPYDAGILSAVGIHASTIEKIQSKQILDTYYNVKDEIINWFSELENEASQWLQEQGVSAKNILVSERLIYARFSGQDETLEIAYSSVDNFQNDFEHEYRRLFGHYVKTKQIEIESIKVKLVEKPKDTLTLPQLTGTNIVKQGEDLFACKVEELKSGDIIEGPAVIMNATNTSFIDKGWEAVVNQEKDLRLNRKGRIVENTSYDKGVELELFANRFISIVSDMGALLQRTSFSVNIKERLDFSCALLDENGYLVVNAPHIPVHLGALGICARSVLNDFKLQDGDIIITNHPANGGSHLPDVTLLAPVFHNGDLVCYVANRAHHSEIGGITPGSMPANAKNLEEEGVVIAPNYIFKEGKPQYDLIEDILQKAKYPTRSITENMADLRAGVAAIHSAQKAVQELCDNTGIARVKANIVALKEYATKLSQKVFEDFIDKPLSAKENLDDGTPISVRIFSRKGKIVFDFEGTGQVQKGNMNATPAIVNSAVLYVLRLLINEDFPLNEGLTENVEIVLPESLLNPDFNKADHECPAVVGGNVEISQRLVDTLLKAFGVAACSQGTMNNLLFGNKAFGYYETICGGVGATKNANGASAVHQHMTNTRITDPEIMELRYPVRLEEFSIRENSGGKGKFVGGNGVNRQIRFLEPVELTILTQHRKEKPYGLNGGSNGKSGRQFLIKTDGRKQEIPGICSLSVSSGEAVRIETPGGGGAMLLS